MRGKMKRKPSIHCAAIAMLFTTISHLAIVDALNMKTTMRNSSERNAKRTICHFLSKIQMVCEMFGTTEVKL